MDEEERRITPRYVFTTAKTEPYLDGEIDTLIGTPTRPRLKDRTAYRARGVFAARQAESRLFSNKREAECWICFRGNERSPFG